MRNKMGGRQFLASIKDKFKVLCKRKALKKSNQKDINDELLMSRNTKYSQYEIGDWTYGNPIIKKWGNDTKLKIGRFCSIAVNVQFLLGGEHRIDWITTYPMNIMIPEASDYRGHPSTKGDVSVGNDVWIGQNVIILSGVSIGDGAVIGAGSVISRDIPAYAVAAGNPAKIIKYRFSEEQILCLQKISWWNWPYDKVIKALPYLLSPDIEEFIKIYYDLRS